MAARPISEKTQLLFLDPVFHLSSGTIDFFIKKLSIILKIGDDKTIIRSERVEFRFGNHPVRVFPSSCRTLGISKQLCFFMCSIVKCFRFNLKIF